MSLVYFLSKINSLIRLFSGKSPGPPVHDRYIMKRASSVTNLSQSVANLSLKGSLDESVFADGDSSPRTVENRKNLSQALLGEKKDGRILEFRARPPPAPEGENYFFVNFLFLHCISFFVLLALMVWFFSWTLGFCNPSSSLYTHSVAKSGAANAKKIPRAIPTAPSRILDAPDLLNDFCKRFKSFFKANFCVFTRASRNFYNFSSVLVWIR